MNLLRDTFSRNPLLSMFYQIYLYLEIRNTTGYRGTIRLTCTVVLLSTVYHVEIFGPALVYLILIAVVK